MIRPPPPIALEIIMNGSSFYFFLIRGTIQLLFSNALQNGSVQSDIPASELYPVNHVDDHEYFPGDFIVEQRDACKLK